MAGRSLVYVDIGIPDAKGFWHSVVTPNMEEFRLLPSTRAGIALAWSLWHIHEWIWYDSHPNENTRNSKRYAAFFDEIIAACPELQWLKDLTNASKHRALAPRAASDVSIDKQAEALGRWGAGGFGVNAPMAIGSGQPQLRLYLRDGSAHWLGDVVERAFSYWKVGHFS